MSELLVCFTSLVYKADRPTGVKRAPTFTNKH